MSAKPSPKFQPSPLMGVYRFREKVGGCNAWYAVDCLGHIADFQVVRSGFSEAQIVDDLSVRVYGKRPALTLIHSRRASSFLPALLARGVRARPSERPAPAPAP